MDEKRIPRPGEKYIHFKQKPYQVIAVATHSETGEKMVVYQALYGDFEAYVRPLSMFVSEVDHERYPQVTQKYRFELAEVLKERAADTQEWKSLEIKDKDIEVEDLNLDEPKIIERMAEAEEEMQQANPVLLEFLDAESYREKREVLINHQRDLTDRLIDDFAVTLDVVIPDGKLEKRFDELLFCIRKFEKYEDNRLR